jgi:hypothetical protein
MLSWRNFKPHFFLWVIRRIQNVKTKSANKNGGIWNCLCIKPWLLSDSRSQDSVTNDFPPPPPLLLLLYKALWRVGIFNMLLMPVHRYSSFHEIPLRTTNLKNGTRSWGVENKFMESTWNPRLKRFLHYYMYTWQLNLTAHLKTWCDITSGTWIVIIPSC